MRMTWQEWMWGAGVVGGVTVLVRVCVHLAAIGITLPAVAFVPIVSRRLSLWVKARDYTEEEMLRADGAPEAFVAVRRQGLRRLAADLTALYAKSNSWGQSVRTSLSDLRFTDASRVPFPFARVVRDTFSLCSVVTASDGPMLRDLDGNWTLDVSGSYGVNVAGFDHYKDWIEQGWNRVKDLGPVLGPLHPIVLENITMLKAVSGMDEVSFHMSGTEAVMAAVRMTRFNTRRKLIVCFGGAYHGWWDGVQPGLGSERAIEDCLVLKDVTPASLKVLRRRRGEIAAVLVNPVQSFHPNAPPPNDAVLLTSGMRKTEDSTEHYARWLRQLRDVCTESGIPLVFDEVYTGFRLAPGGAQDYFGVRADMVVYGKTVGGGLPIGVVCGRTALMRRFDPARPTRMAYVVGTFSAHPAVMGAMHEFLCWVTEPGSAARYAAMNRETSRWTQATNQQLADAAMPVRVMNLGSVWTILFREPSRFNWLLQYYLRAEGVTLSWVGTGRCLCSMDFEREHYDALQAKLVDAARRMRQDGWWLTASEHPQRETHMRTRLIQDFVGSVVAVPKPLATFYTAVMQRKKDDHHASHSDKTNQLIHLVSSSVFIWCYATIFTDLTKAMCWGLASLCVRQLGHAVIEPPCHDKEALLLGYTTRDKTLVVLGYLMIPFIDVARGGTWSASAFPALLDLIALHWFRWTVFVVSLRVALLTWKHDFRISMIWFVKLITDPLTDIVAYFPRRPQRA
jgi:glutamate-1-semialdehyde 2,1-aminomutase